MKKLDNRIDRQIDALVGALTDPIIVFDAGWADVLPDWLKGAIKMQRLAQLIKGEEGIATDAEALAYVSNASLCHPIACEWVDSLCQAHRNNRFSGCLRWVRGPG